MTHYIQNNAIQDSKLIKTEVYQRVISNNMRELQAQLDNNTYLENSWQKLTQQKQTQLQQQRVYRARAHLETTIERMYLTMLEQLVLFATRKSFLQFLSLSLSLSLSLLSLSLSSPLSFFPTLCSSYLCVGV